VPTLDPVRRLLHAAARGVQADLKGPLAPGVLAWLAERTGLAAGSLDGGPRRRRAGGWAVCRAYRG